MGPSLEFTAPHYSEGTRDLRYGKHNVSKQEIRDYYDTNPMTGRLEGWARQGTGRGFRYTQQPNSSTGGYGRWRGGTAAGGMIFLPPELDMEAAIGGQWDALIAVGGVSTSTFLMGPSTELGFGSPNLSTGQTMSGYSLRNDGGTLVMSTLDASSTETEAFRFTDERALEIDEITSLTTPGAGFVSLFAKGKDLYQKDSDGLESVLTGPPVALVNYIESNSKNTVQNVHGSLHKEVDADTLSTGVPIAWDRGIGKIMIAALAGSDFAGTLTITGTSVDRDTGAESGGSDTETIDVDALTVDSTSTDAEGNTVYAFTDAYISTKWWKGSVTISTTDLNLSDVDIYQVSFEQCNDSGSIEVDTFDINAFCTNTAAWLYAYLYSVEVAPGGTKKVNLVNFATLSVTLGDSETSRFYRLRKSNLAKTLDGTTQGVFVNLIMGANNGHWEDVTMKVWAKVKG